MIRERFLGTWRAINRENRLHRYLLVTLVVANLLLVFALLRSEHTVVLVPPILEGEVSIARNHASVEVKEAWALYAAELLGNVSPSGASFLKDVLDPLLAAPIRVAVFAALDAQVTEIQRERVSMSFSPREVRYDPSTDRVRVSGIQTTRGPAAKPVSRQRTYEIAIAFRNYRPRIEYLNVVRENRKPEQSNEG